MNEVQSKPLAKYIATCIDTWRESNPELTCPDILRALEIIRFQLTEAMIKAGSKWDK